MRGSRRTSHASCARLNREVPDVRLWQEITDEEGGINWWRQITEALDTVENMILVLSPASARSPTVQKEWRDACASKGSASTRSGGAAFDQLALDALPRWIGKTHIYDLEYEWKKFVNYLRSPGRAVRVPFMAPDPPEHLVARPDELGRLLTLVLGADHRDPSAVRAALRRGGLRQDGPRDRRLPRRRRAHRLRRRHPLGHAGRETPAPRCANEAL